MRKILYYVACSIDGFISGQDGDISGFVSGGSGVDKYLNDLAAFDTVIMGRNTYEFGYRYGLKPGRPAYPHMKHYIFSNTLEFADPDPKVEVRKIQLEEIEKIKQQPGTDIYLCGGGEFAGWLLENHQIDILKLKLNPFIQGKGVRLFGASQKEVQLDLKGSEIYDNGLQIMTYQIIY